MPRKRALPKETTTVRLTPEAKAMMAELAERAGLTQAAWLESIVRREARRLGVTVPVIVRGTEEGKG